jgi:hypothetical protein
MRVVALKGDNDSTCIKGLFYIPDSEGPKGVLGSGPTHKLVLLWKIFLKVNVAFLTHHIWIVDQGAICTCIH